MCALLPAHWRLRAPQLPLVGNYPDGEMYYNDLLGLFEAISKTVDMDVAILTLDIVSFSFSLRAQIRYPRCRI